MNTTSKSHWMGAIALVIAVLAAVLAIFAIVHGDSNNGWGMMGGYRGTDEPGMMSRSDGQGMMHGDRGGYGSGMMGGYRGTDEPGMMSRSDRRGMMQGDCAGYGPGMMGRAFGIPTPSSSAWSESANDVNAFCDSRH
jgi:hypothetical protein